MFGANKNTVSKWWISYQEQGDKGSVSKKKGIKSEDKKYSKRIASTETGSYIRHYCNEGITYLNKV